MLFIYLACFFLCKMVSLTPKYIATGGVATPVRVVKVSAVRQIILSPGEIISVNSGMTKITEQFCVPQVLLIRGKIFVRPLAYLTSMKWWRCRMVKY
jgi:hypothetical protein